MYRHSSIRSAIFAALVAAGPIVFYRAGRQYPDALGQLLLVAWLLYAGWAVVLRSPIIAGVLSAPFVLVAFSLAGPPVSCTRYYVPSETGLIVFAAVMPIIGAIGGWICHTLYVSRRRQAALQSNCPDDSIHSHGAVSG
ncbi:MAG TPA: hypothetical protein VEI07_20240 [Planctomycetaceae bacterium]|nr:hypothetical protein [Planctomycetaceae bacterium]